MWPSSIEKMKKEKDFINNEGSLWICKLIFRLKIDVELPQKNFPVRFSYQILSQWPKLN